MAGPIYQIKFLTCLEQLDFSWNLPSVQVLPGEIFLLFRQEPVEGAAGIRSRHGPVTGRTVPVPVGDAHFDCGRVQVFERLVLVRSTPVDARN